MTFKTLVTKLKRFSLRYFFKKTNTIKAHKYLIEHYKSYKENGFDSVIECPLCKIHYSWFFLDRCKGCPLASLRGQVGCYYSKSFDTLQIALEHSLATKEGLQIAFENRAQFHRDLVDKYLLKRPWWKFYRWGWTYLKTDLE